MCVIFWSERGSFDIPHVFDVIRYDLLRRSILANVSVIVSNPHEKEATVGVVHRRAVKVEPAVWRWYRHSRGEKDWVVNIVSRLYDSSFKTGKDLIIKFNRERMRGNLQEPTVAKEETGFRSIVLQSANIDYADIAERYVPFTAFVFGPLPPRTKWFYSFDIRIEGRAFDVLMGEQGSCTVDGAAILRGKILNEDLAVYDEDNPWKDYFLERICTRIVKPSRYDTMITNGIGALPICYRLCNRTRRELIEDQDINKKVAWFTSDDPNQDFIIELEFADQEVERELTA